VKTERGELEVVQVAGVADAIEAIPKLTPVLTAVDPSIAGADREALVRQAEAFGSYVIAGRPGVQIPGASMEEIEKYSILETLKSVGGSTSKAAKVLGISVRKIQYRLKDWNLRPAQVAGGTAVVEARH
jgi:transcriptional regulator of acetoin/glycerol metabolism